MDCSNYVDGVDAARIVSSGWESLHMWAHALVAEYGAPGCDKRGPGDDHLTCDCQRGEPALDARWGVRMSLRAIVDAELHRRLQDAPEGSEQERSLSAALTGDDLLAIQTLRLWLAEERSI